MCSSTFPSTRSFLHSLALDSFFHHQSNNIPFQICLFLSLTSAFLIISPSLTLTLHLPFFPYKDPCDHIVFLYIIRDNLSISRFLFTTAKFPFPYKVTYSHVLVIHMLLSLGIHHSVQRRRPV